MKATFDREWLAARVDISCVRSQHSRNDVTELAGVAAGQGFVSAHVLPHWLPVLRSELEGTGVLAGAPVGFPSGGAHTASKLQETTLLLESGAQELDVVVNVGRLKSGDLGYCRDEARAIIDLIARRVPTRLILEVSLLDDDEIRIGCDVAIDAGFDYIKTGTGWAGPTTIDQVAVIANHVRGEIAIKAAGGVRTIQDISDMTNLGVTRFGINQTTAVQLVTQLAESS